MWKKQVETIITYYYGIPAMVKLLKQEKADWETEYCGLHGIPVDGLPHGSTPGNPTASLAERMDEKRVKYRMDEIDVKIQVLAADEAAIRGCLDALRGEYKKLLSLRCLSGYSWARISTEIGVPDTTARRRYRKAMDRLGEALDEVPMAEEILGRASRARV